jgi:hypothetical protein
MLVFGGWHPFHGTSNQVFELDLAPAEYEGDLARWAHTSQRGGAVPQSAPPPRGFGPRIVYNVTRGLQHAQALLALPFRIAARRLRL